jgi:ribonuclease M5
MLRHERLKIAQAVIVEGKCDKTVLENVIDATIIPVNGFGIYKDKAKHALIRRYAEQHGVILLTDSDNAGRQIRNYLKNVLRGCEIRHVYVPNLYEVEDTDSATLRNAFLNFNCQSSTVNRQLTRQRLLDDGLIGAANSAAKRRELLRRLKLPENLSVTALLDVLNKCDCDYERIIETWYSQA